MTLEKGNIHLSSPQADFFYDYARPFDDQPYHFRGLDRSKNEGKQREGVSKSANFPS